MNAKFHQRTLDLLDRRFEPVGCESLITWGRMNNIVIPASVSEWYTLPDALDILRTYSNNDHPYQPSKFKLHQQDDWSIIEFMREHQSCCDWGFLLDGTEDPPVVIQIDADWSPCADHFSTFIYTQIFDWQYFYLEQDEEENYEDWSRVTSSVTKELLSQLLRFYQEEPRTWDYPGGPTYRYSGNRQRIIILDYDRRAYWSLLGATRQARAALREWIPEIWMAYGLWYK